jgi:hypothetical protein
MEAAVPVLPPNLHILQEAWQRDAERSLHVIAGCYLILHDYQRFVFDVRLEEIDRASGVGNSPSQPVNHDQAGLKHTFPVPKHPLRQYRPYSSHII